VDRIKGVDQDLRVPNPTQNLAKSHQSAFRDRIQASESNPTGLKRLSRLNNSLSIVQEGSAAAVLIKAYSSSQPLMEGIRELLLKLWPRNSFRSLIKSTLHRWMNIRTIRRVRELGYQTSHKIRLNHLRGKVVKYSSSSNWIRSMNCRRVGEKPASNCSKFIRGLRMPCALPLNAKLEHLLFNRLTSYASATTISNPSSRLVEKSKGTSIL
jgi:hypothetical protein